MVLAEVRLLSEGVESSIEWHMISQDWRVRSIGPRFILQQDKDPKHTAKVIQNYLWRKEASLKPLDLEQPTSRVPTESACQNT